jgi:hypothetical protein
MKTKTEYIHFWIDQAEDDWKAVDTLLKEKTLCNHYSLHILLLKSYVNLYGLNTMKKMSHREFII